MLRQPAPCMVTPESGIVRHHWSHKSNVRSRRTESEVVRKEEGLSRFTQARNGGGLCQGHTGAECTNTREASRRERQNYVQPGSSGSSANYALNAQHGIRLDSLKGCARTLC